MEDLLFQWFDNRVSNVVANLVAYGSGITGLVTGTVKLYTLILHSRTIFRWKDINKAICTISKKMSFTPDLIIGNSIISNILDETYPSCETIQLIEIDSERYEAEKEAIQQHFVVAKSEMWIHLVDKMGLELFLKKTPNPRIVIFLNYISAGEVCKVLKRALVEFFEEANTGVKDSNIFIATPFVSKEKTRKYARGETLQVDFYWKEIKSWRSLYLPWGHISKSQRRGEQGDRGMSYLCSRSKLWYKLRGVRKPR